MNYTVYMWNFRTQRAIVVQSGLSQKLAEKCTNGLNRYAPMTVEFWYRKVT